jgi:hypothetical protein
VLCGLDDFRVRVQENGVGSMDVSDYCQDHGVPLGVVYLVMYGISHFIYQIPARVEQGIWFIVLLLVIIAVLTILAGGNVGSVRPFRAW